MWIFSAIANAIGNNFIGRPNYLFDLLFNRVKADGGVTEAQQCSINQLTDLQNDNLLSSASLIITPSSYKETKLYSVIPSDGSGDFTFTRATTATRVNSDGLVELVPYNLISYSNTFSNGVWTKANTTIVSSNNTAPDGTLTATRLNMLSGNTSQLYNSFPTVAGTYTTSIWIRLVSGNGNFKLGFFDGASILTDTITVTSTWQRFSVTKTVAAAGGTRGCWLYSDDLNQVVEVWGGQVVEGSTSRNYQYTETRLNIPRLDYSLGGCPNILLEPQRTNFSLQSQTFDNATWIKVGSTVSANTIASPDGIINADSLVEDNSNGLHITYQNFSSNKSTYTYSCYIKPNTRTRVYLRTDTSDGTVRTLFDLTGSGSVVTLAHTSASITLGNNGWYRCSIIFTEGTASPGRLFAIEAAVVSSISYVGNGLTAFYLWGSQLEIGAYITSYIPTTSAIITKTADVFIRDNIYTNNLITSSGGTWFIELKNNTAYTSDSNVGAIFLDTANFGYTNGLSIRKLTSNRIRIQSYASTVGSSLYQTTTDNVKIAIKWNGTTADVFVNGVKEVSAAAFTTTNMQFLGNNTTPFLAYISSMLLYPTPLTDDQLEALTGIGFDTYAAMASYYNYTLQ